MVNIEDYNYPKGLHLLTRWQSGCSEAKAEMMQLFDASISGEFDTSLGKPTPSGEIHATASVHMLGLSILFDLYGVESADYYKTDPWRYVRTNLVVSRLLGVNKMYVTWALYALTCEPLGQKMMYPDRFPPGCEPNEPLLNKDNWRALETPDFSTGVPKAIEEILRVTEILTGLPPLLQITAPYSLAADIYGQEPLLADVVHDPANVNALLDHLADTVLGPWMDHHINTFPNGWIELSDASGSPFFIGAENCKHMSIRSIQRMVQNKPYVDRVFDNNYRGDYVSQAEKKVRGSRRRKSNGDTGKSIDLLELTEAKISVCPRFVMRLEADKVDVGFYADQAIQRNMPLTCGIGSPQIDRNSIGELDAAKVEIRKYAEENVGAVKRVCEGVDLPPNNFVDEPWPSHIYFEDVNSQSQFELMELVLDEVNQAGSFDFKTA